MVDIKMLSLALSVDVKKAVFDLRIIHKNIRTDVKPSEFVALYDGTWNVVNIYELMHKCKKWALTQGYDIASSSQGYANITTLDSINQHGYFAQDTEFEAVLKAAQWVLNNKDKK